MSRKKLGEKPLKNLDKATPEALSNRLEYLMAFPDQEAFAGEATQVCEAIELLERRSQVMETDRFKKDDRLKLNEKGCRIFPRKIHQEATCGGYTKTRNHFLLVKWDGTRGFTTYDESFFEKV